MARLALGVDLGGTNARAAVVDVSTGAIVSVRKELLLERGPEAVVRVVAGLARGAAADAGVAPASLGTAGVGVAGQCLGLTGIVVNAPQLGWRNVAFGGMLAGALSQPVRVTNDLSAAAAGEHAFGAAKGVSDALVVFVGSGVGAGLVLGGRLYEGAYGVAGELGHVKVRPPRAEQKERRCGCGEWGCLEAYAGGVNVAARVREDVNAGLAERVKAIAGADANVSAATVEAAYAEGDLYARELWGELGALLGRAIANVTTLLNPARVVLGGGVLAGCANLSRIVRAQVMDKTARAARAGVEVVPAELGDDAGLVGAATLTAPRT
ncbi:MAG TPA: ROK family protein [Anaeromyxobacteraceae bacterium]|nr:ROK family protein [Anaeromyxobacteraceae bacterium]